jgi:hypothetical protein
VSVAYKCPECGEWMRLWCHCCGLCLHEPEGPQCCHCTQPESFFWASVWGWLRGMF